MRREFYLFLCDYSGTWSQPYRDAGYNTIQVDTKFDGDSTDEDGNLRLGMSVQTFRDEGWTEYYKKFCQIHGIVMMPPCTDFTISGSRWWKEKDADGRTQASIEIVEACLDIKDSLKPDWWVLENPVGRLPTLFPERLGKSKKYIHPWHYAGHADNPEEDAFTKKTGLWGDFNTALPEHPVDPVMYTAANGKRGSWMWMKLGGKSERTKELRSKTPQGFARAWFKANQ